jgi:hypothetical protein
MKRILLVAVSVTLGMVVCHAVDAINVPRASVEQSHAVPGRFVVKLKSTVRPEQISQSLAAGQRFERVSPLKFKGSIDGATEWNRWYTLAVDDSALSVGQAARIVGADNIEIIEPDYTLEFFSLPDDSLFNWQWYLHNTGQDFPAVLRRAGDFNDTLVIRQGTPGADVGLTPLYQSPPAEHTKVVVAIVDTGVDPKHPELQGQFWRNPDEIPGNGIDDDHNGFVDDTLGYDVSGDILSFNNQVPDNDPTDIIGHGTHIAGIIAGAANGRGIVGLAPSAVIMPVKIRPNATTSVASAGILYAVNAGAKVINISWGTGYRSFVVEDALRIARLNGVFVAIAMGNSGNNARLYPAADDNSFGVAAGDADGNMTAFSTWGPTVQVVAPGQDILSLRAANTDLYASANEPGVHIIDSQYYLADGTSMAAPMVAGAAALILTYRPDLNLDQLESVLKMGAVDMIDPLKRGDSLPERDTISGYGYLNVANSLNLLNHGGLYIVSPTERGRYLDSMVVTIAPVAGYTGGWTLSWSSGGADSIWQTLASGVAVPGDSIAIVIRDDIPAGTITLRLTDDFGSSVYAHAILVHGRGLSVTSPRAGDTLNYFIPVIGSAFGVGFDSLTIEYQYGASTPVKLITRTAEIFDTIMYSWSASGVLEGSYILRVQAYFKNGPVDSVHIPFFLHSAFALGWPQTLSGRSGLTPVCADLDHDGTKELIVATAFGIDAFYSDGRRLPGFPALIDHDLRGIPAIYDVDKDGNDDIICTAADGIHVVTGNAAGVPGWPQKFDMEPSGYGFPTPTVTSFGGKFDSVITLIDNQGTVRAHRLSGAPYFYSTYGRYASFLGYAGDGSFFNGNSVTATDLDGDGKTEVIATYSTLLPSSGVALFDGRTAQPAFDLPYSHVISGYGVYGTVLADLNGDNLPEIITVGYDESGMRTVWVKTRGVNDLPGWPRTFPEIPAWRGNYPMVADLDLDGVPEILVTFFEFDICCLYIFRADGSPYVARPSRPAGEAFRAAVTLSSATVGNLTGDSHPEIALRGGHILPSGGTEMVYVLNYLGRPIPGWPIATPANPDNVFSTPFAPLIDDIDNDGQAELALVSEPGVLYVWNFPAQHDSTKTHGRVLLDNKNGGILRPAKSPTDVDSDNELLPTSIVLHQNYPNPFNPSTTISFDLPERSEVQLTVYNILGQRVTALFAGTLSPGVHHFPFNGSSLASGTYFYKLETRGKSITKKMALLK